MWTHWANVDRGDPVPPGEARALAAKCSTPGLMFSSTGPRLALAFAPLRLGFRVLWRRVGAVSPSAVFLVDG